MTDGITDNIVWIQGTRMSWFNTRLGPEKRKKPTIYICIIYLICKINCIYLICILYILYIAYKCKVKSEWYINRTSFTRYIVEPTGPMVLRITSSYEEALVNTSLCLEKRKKANNLYMYYISYM